jgi:DinB superfamily
MSPSLIPIAHLFAVGDLMMDRLVGDFSAADWRHRDAMGHDARWIVGHLAVYRCRVAAWAGQPKSTMDWESAFQRGTSPAAVPDSLESSLLLAEFHAAHARMEIGFPTLTDAALQHALSRKLPDGSDTIGGAIRFMVWHEAYHLGQLGLLRRLVGKLGIV